jgi:hypothetical protein
MSDAYVNDDVAVKCDATRKSDHLHCLLLDGHAGLHQNATQTWSDSEAFRV